MKKTISILVLFMLVFLNVSSTSFATITQQEIFYPTPEIIEYGSAVDMSINGDYAIVGAQRDNLTGSSMGSAFIYFRTESSWQLQQKITATTPINGEYFGASVAMSDDGSYVVVGAKGTGTVAGAAYVFTRSGTTWTQQQKLTSTGILAGEYYGNDVDISESGDSIVIGARSHKWGGSSERGAAFVFIRSGTTWIQIAKFSGIAIADGDGLGSAVTITSKAGDLYAIIGAPGIATGGKVFVYRYEFNGEGMSWYLKSSFSADDVSAGDYFGNDLDVSYGGEYLIVGTNQTTDAVYIFTRSVQTWSQQQKLTASNATPVDYFGFDTALDSTGSYAIVGARYKESAYVFSRSGTTWTEDKILTGSDSVNDDYFGTAVALSDSNKYYIVGAHNSYKAYVYNNIIAAVPEFSTYIFITTLLFGFAVIFHKRNKILSIKTQ